MKKIIIGLLMLVMCFVSCKTSDEIPNDPPLPPQKTLPTIVSFIADKSILEVGETTSISWNVINATRVELSFGTHYTLIGEVPLVGSYKTKTAEMPNKYNSYQLYAYNEYGKNSAYLEIQVKYPEAPAVEYRVSGSTNKVSITYANSNEGTSQLTTNTPWSYKFSTAKTGQFLYVSAQNQRSSGTVIVEIYRHGTLYKKSESSGAYCIATASGTY
jgi:hypothetical protein